MPKTIKAGSTELQLEGLQIPLDELIPNPDQPRQGPILDATLRRSISETKGLTTPLLVETIPKGEVESAVQKLKERYKDEDNLVRFLDKCRPSFMIIDGERRWANCVKLVSEDNRDLQHLQNLPVDLINQTLNESDRYILWVSIHKLRKDWRAMEQEGAAQRLIQILNDDAKAASILGVTESRLKKFVEIYELAKEFEPYKGRKAISYARELLNLSSKLRTPEIMAKVKEKISSNIIADPVAIRKLRRILTNPEATQRFLSDGATIQDALAYLTPNEFNTSSPLFSNLVAFRQLVSNYNWNDFQALKKNPGALLEVEQCLSILNDFKKILSG